MDVSKKAALLCWGIPFYNCKCFASRSAFSAIVHDNHILCFVMLLILNIPWNLERLHIVQVYLVDSAWDCGSNPRQDWRMEQLSWNSNTNIWINLRSLLNVIGFLHGRRVLAIICSLNMTTIVAIFSSDRLKGLNRILSRPEFPNQSIIPCIAVLKGFTASQLCCYGDNFRSERSA